MEITQLFCHITPLPDNKIETTNLDGLMFKIEKSSFRRSTLSVAVMGLLSSGAMAQDTQQKDDDDFEQIIVTATKRAESIEDIPFSINAQTQRDFERSGAGNLEDVARNVASVSIQNLGPGQSQVSMRGWFTVNPSRARPPRSLSKDSCAFSSNRLFAYSNIS